MIDISSVCLVWEIYRWCTDVLYRFV